VNLTTLEDETSKPCETSGTKRAVTQTYIPEELTLISVLIIRIVDVTGFTDTLKPYTIVVAAAVLASQSKSEDKEIHSYSLFNP
jgi:hypothetical protein